MNISKIEALGILNIDDSVNAQEAYEEILFTWKQKYLSNLPPVKVMKAHILKLERIHEAGKLFIDFDEVERKNEDFNFFDSTLLKVLQKYQPVLMNLKLKISSAKDANVVIDAMESLVELQRKMATKVAEYNPTTDSFIFKDVKISSPNDFHAAQKELMIKDISETEIMNYLRTELKFGSYPYNSVLLNEVLKATKQIVS